MLQGRVFIGINHILTYVDRCDLHVVYNIPKIYLEIFWTKYLIFGQYDPYVVLEQSENLLGNFFDEIFYFYFFVDMILLWFRTSQKFVRKFFRLYILKGNFTKK